MELYYDEDEIQFKGKYLNWKIINNRIVQNNGDPLELELKSEYGKEKEYKNNGRIKYDGDYSADRLVFEGEYLHGKGVGKEFYSNKSKFDVEFSMEKELEFGSNIIITENLYLMGNF